MEAAALSQEEEEDDKEEKQEEEGEAAGMWYPADMNDLHVGHVMHDLCKINNYYELEPSASCITL